MEPQGGKVWSWSRPPAGPLPQEERTCALLGCPREQTGHSAHSALQRGRLSPGTVASEGLSSPWEELYGGDSALPLSEPLHGSCPGPPRQGQAWWVPGTVSSPQTPLGAVPAVSHSWSFSQVWVWPSWCHMWQTHCLAGS